jgi:hypothetical protein
MIFGIRLGIWEKPFNSRALLAKIAAILENRD